MRGRCKGEIRQLLAKGIWQPGKVRLHKGRKVTCVLEDDRQMWRAGSRTFAKPDTAMDHIEAGR